MHTAAPGSEVNDTHGHDIGDAVLRMTASRLRNALRKADAVGRWGGEEFVALLPGADESAARRARDRIMESVRAPMSLAVGPLSTTISIGVAIRESSAGTADTSIDELLKKADKALYQAKQNGRDRMEIAD